MTMREYKFKAYDTVNKILVDIDGDSLFIADGKVYEVEERSSGYSQYMHKKNVSDRYIPVQFTGKKAIANSDDVGLRPKISRIDWYSSFFKPSSAKGWEVFGEAIASETLSTLMLKLFHR